MLGPWQIIPSGVQPMHGPSGAIVDGSLFIVDTTGAVYGAYAQHLPALTTRPPWIYNGIPYRLALTAVCDGLVLGLGETYSFSAETIVDTVDYWFVAPHRCAQTDDAGLLLEASPNGDTVMSVNSLGTVLTAQTVR